MDSNDITTENCQTMTEKEQRLYKTPETTQQCNSKKAPHINVNLE